MSAFFKLLTVLSFALYFRRSSAILRNITYDNTDPSVAYLPPGEVPGGWELNITESLDYDGSHALADNVPGASAIFQFSGSSERSPLSFQYLNTTRRCGLLFRAALAIQRFHCSLPRSWPECDSVFVRPKRHTVQWWPAFFTFRSAIWIHWVI